MGAGDPRQLEGIPAQGDGVRQGGGIGVLEAEPQAPNATQSQGPVNSCGALPAEARVFLRTIAGLGRGPCMPAENLRPRRAGLLPVSCDRLRQCSRPRPRARPSLRTKSGLADRLRLTASGSAAQPRPTRGHASGRGPRAGGAGPAARRGFVAASGGPPLPAASARIQWLRWRATSPGVNPAWSRSPRAAPSPSSS